MELISNRRIFGNVEGDFRSQQIVDFEAEMTLRHSTAQDGAGERNNKSNRYCNSRQLRMGLENLVSIETASTTLDGVGGLVLFFHLPVGTTVSLMTSE
jgi:hypothetical protein